LVGYAIPLRWPQCQLDEEENLNSNAASIPPRIYMKTNDRNSPNPGKLHFALPARRNIFRQQSWQWDGGRRVHPGDENLNSNAASIPPQIYMKTNDGNSPNPGEIHFVLPERRYIFRQQAWEWDGGRTARPGNENSNSNPASIPPPPPPADLYENKGRKFAESRRNWHFAPPERRNTFRQEWRR
jgi:hypothetical protein